MTDLSKIIKGSTEGAMYHHIFTHAPNAQFIADAETGEIIECNARAEILIGRTRDQIIGMHQSELHPKSEEEKYKKIFALHAERGYTADFEGEVQHSDGRRIPIMISAQDMELRGRKVILGIFVDMTEHILIEEQLKSMNQQIEFILGATKTGLDIIDSEYNVRYIDPAWKKIYGEPAGRKCYEYFMGAKQACPGCGIPRALATKQPNVTEEILVKENNRPIQVNTIPFQNKKGEWLVAEVNVDITARKQAEKEREQLVAIIEATPDFVGYADAKDKHIIYINKAGRRIVGIGEDEDVAKFKIWDVHPDWTNKMFPEKIFPIAMRDGSWMGECAFLNIRDKHEIPVLMVLSSHKAPGGEVEVFSTISRDITERKTIEDELRYEVDKRKKAEIKIRDNERRFRELTESLPQLVWTCLPDGLCSYLSRQWIEYTGIPEAEQLGSGWLQQIYPDDSERVIAAWNKAVKKNLNFDLEFRIRRNDGVYRWFKTRAIPLCGADGAVVRWFGSNTDIEDLKLTEEALKDSEEKLSVQKAALEQKNIALREIMEQIGAEKYRLKEDVLANVDKVLLPVLRKLRVKATRIERRHIDVLQKSLEGLASSFSRTMADTVYRLTPREVEICSMTRSRLTSKEMSKMLHISRRSVETHRHNIRKKLGLANRKVNLTSWLQIH